MNNEQKYRVFISYSKDLISAFSPNVLERCEHDLLPPGRAA